MFDRVIVVDWSGKATRSPVRESRDAIWIGVAEAARDWDPKYCRTREEAMTWLHERLAEGGRQLVGFDFPMGYPAGFARRLTGTDDARTLHRWLADRVVDSATNANNRFEVAAEINRRIGGTGVFWGCPRSRRLPCLSSLKAPDYEAVGIAEKRRVERENPPAKPVWQLLGAGSVGSQALLGIPAIHRLAVRTGAAVWPFEPPRDITLAEVYPSLLAPAVLGSGDPIPDRAQVRLLSLALHRLAQAGKLAPLLETPPEAAEEGWILGAGQAPLLREALAWA